MDKQAYINEVKLKLTGGVLDIEIDDATIGTLIDSAFREVQRYIDTTKISGMISAAIEEEMPFLKNNSLLFDLVSYTVLEDLKTVQSVKNVLSCIKKANAKKVKEVFFKNGEISIQCLI